MIEVAIDLQDQSQVNVTLENAPGIGIDVPGVQGPKGDQNVYVGSTAPQNPQVGWVWIKI